MARKERHKAAGLRMSGPGDGECSSCHHFKRQEECELVEGRISSDMTCDLHEDKNV